MAICFGRGGGAPQHGENEIFWPVVFNACIKTVHQIFVLSLSQISDVSITTFCLVFSWTLT